MCFLVRPKSKKHKQTKTHCLDSVRGEGPERSAVSAEPLIGAGPCVPTQRAANLELSRAAP